jgi:carboxylesterase
LSNAEPPAPRPARDFTEAAARFAAVRAREGPEISSAGRSRFYGHGERTATAVVLIHGFTNCPQQWDMFAGELQRAGYSVVVPRLPGHGHRYRATRAPASIGAASLLAAVSEGVDIACGASERVVLAGLSIGATMALRIAFARDDVANAVAIVPFFAPAKLGLGATARLTTVLEFVPNFFVPWDPHGDGSQIPGYGYPKFASRMLAESLRIGLAVDALAQRGAPAGRATFLLNAKEPAVNNDATLAVRTALEQARGGGTVLRILENLPANHDIIDPTNPRARVDLVYPALREIIAS